MPSQPDKNGSLGEIFWPEGVQDMMTSSEKGPTSEQVETLHNLVGKNFDVFSLSPKDVGRTSLVRHQIHTGEARPVRQLPQWLPFAKKEEAGEQVIKMRKAGIIEPSVSPWVSPIVLVRKDGTTRFCVD